ncbi:hypothetical protein HDU97_003526 [Phlyctochytrium planicorne]|nr:hypothetical protein HDU97_003526 [Phlyctochytrium planicorne]
MEEDHDNNYTSTFLDDVEEDFPNTILAPQPPATRSSLAGVGVGAATSSTPNAASGGAMRGPSYVNIFASNVTLENNSRRSGSNSNMGLVNSSAIHPQKLHQKSTSSIMLDGSKAHTSSMRAIFSKDSKVTHASSMIEIDDKDDVEIDTDRDYIQPSREFGRNSSQQAPRRASYYAKNTMSEDIESRRPAGIRKPSWGTSVTASSFSRQRLFSRPMVNAVIQDGKCIPSRKYLSYPESTSPIPKPYTLLPDLLFGLCTVRMTHLLISLPSYALPRFLMMTFSLLITHAILFVDHDALFAKDDLSHLLYSGFRCTIAIGMSWTGLLVFNTIEPSIVSFLLFVVTARIIHGVVLFLVAWFDRRASSSLLMRILILVPVPTALWASAVLVPAQFKGWRDIFWTMAGVSEALGMYLVVFLEDRIAIRGARLAAAAAAAMAEATITSSSPASRKHMEAMYWRERELELGALSMPLEESVGMAVPTVFDWNRDIRGRSLRLTTILAAAVGIQALYPLRQGVGEIDSVLITYGIGPFACTVMGFLIIFAMERISTTANPPLSLPTSDETDSNDQGRASSDGSANPSRAFDDNVDGRPMRQQYHNSAQSNPSHGIGTLAAAAAAAAVRLRPNPTTASSTISSYYHSRQYSQHQNNMDRAGQHGRCPSCQKHHSQYQNAPNDYWRYSHHQNGPGTSQHARGNPSSQDPNAYTQEDKTARRSKRCTHKDLPDSSTAAAMIVSAERSRRTAELNPPLATLWRLLQFPIHLCLLVTGTGLRMVLQSLFDSWSGNAGFLPTVPPGLDDVIVNEAGGNLLDLSTLAAGPSSPLEDMLVAPAPTGVPSTGATKSLSYASILLNYTTYVTGGTSSLYPNSPQGWWDPRRGETLLSLGLACFVLFTALSSLTISTSASITGFISNSTGAAGKSFHARQNSSQSRCSYCTSEESYLDDEKHDGDHDDAEEIPHDYHPRHDDKQGDHRAVSDTDSDDEAESPIQHHHHHHHHHHSTRMEVHDSGGEEIRVLDEKPTTTGRAPSISTAASVQFKPAVRTRSWTRMSKRLEKMNSIVTSSDLSEREEAFWRDVWVTSPESSMKSKKQTGQKVGGGKDGGSKGNPIASLFSGHPAAAATNEGPTDSYALAVSMASGGVVVSSNDATKEVKTRRRVSVAKRHDEDMVPLESRVVNKKHAKKPTESDFEKSGVPMRRSYYGSNNNVPPAVASAHSYAVGHSSTPGNRINMNEMVQDKRTFRAPALHAGGKQHSEPILTRSGHYASAYGPSSRMDPIGKGPRILRSAAVESEYGHVDMGYGVASGRGDKHGAYVQGGFEHASQQQIQAAQGQRHSVSSFQKYSSPPPPPHVPPSSLSSSANNKPQILVTSSTTIYNASDPKLNAGFNAPCNNNNSNLKASQRSARQASAAMAAASCHDSHPWIETCPLCDPDPTAAVVAAIMMSRARFYGFVFRMLQVGALVSAVPLSTFLTRWSGNGVGLVGNPPGEQMWPFYNSTDPSASNETYTVPSLPDWQDGGSPTQHVPNGTGFWTLVLCSLIMAIAMLIEEGQRIRSRG